VVNVHALIAVGVNAEGYREILGIDVTTAQDGAGWLTFLRSLTATGLSGVRLVTSDAHAGLLGGIGATLPGAAWQRCRTHYATNLMAVRRAHGHGYALCCTQSTTNQTLILLQHSMIGSSTLSPTSSPRSLIILRTHARTFWRSPHSPNRSGDKSGPTTPKNVSTKRSGGAQTSSASSPTGAP
jgi:putative transposase